MVGYGTHNQPAGTWSDDTSMLLATLDSLKKINIKLMLKI
ncbi:ADP-ribosylglycohydrolase family protein [Streptobacillus ratti]|nr:ADP-ribosylglycohydrolase family protein [Streptobacillus ratti]